MTFNRAEIPYGGYWSTPFAKWQGSLQHLHALRFAAQVGNAELAKRGLEARRFDFGVLGTTVLQHRSFFGAPWPFFEMGMGHVAGPTINQVCATGARALLTCAAEVELGMADLALSLTADRVSNGATAVYPAPGGPGGTAQAENIVLESFSSDPQGGHSMAQTAENVAAKLKLSMSEQHEVVLLRTAQYQAALADDHAFQKRYMTLPFSIPKPNFKGEAGTLTGDEGVTVSTAAGLAKLKPVLPNGTLTFGSQTHPADGNAAIIVASSERARELSKDPGIRIRLLGFGQARAALGFMPEAPVPAAQAALRNAGITLAQVRSVKSHNPFAVNDLCFSRATGWPLERMNNFGCSLIWGHPQAPTGTRSIIELIEELVLAGGGIGLYTGCAAGDSGSAVVLEVSDRPA
jgi:acetyl-CoA acetyltransferase